MRRIGRVASLVAIVWFVGMPHLAEAEPTSADNLLALSQNASAIQGQALQDQIMTLFSDLGVRKEVSERFERLHFWDVKRVGSSFRSEDEGNSTIISNGSVTLESATSLVIIAAGDVTIQSGSNLLVIAGGNIRFGQHPSRTRAGVFLTKKSLTVDWAADMFVHARNGARFNSQSVKILAYNTKVSADSPIDIGELTGKPVFSDSPSVSVRNGSLPRFGEGIRFAGQRCRDGVALAEIADRVPALALTKGYCKKVDLLVARCGRKAGLPEGEELWTVHMCENVLTEIRIRKKEGRAQYDFYNPRADRPAPRSEPSTTSK